MAKTEKTERALKKVSAQQIKLSDKKSGFRLSGKFVGISQREYIDKEGEVKNLHQMVIEDATGDRIKFLADAGLRTAIDDAMLKAGDYFEAVKGEKIAMSQGRTMNTWDIFQYAE